MTHKAIPMLALAVVLGSAAAWHWWPRLAPTPAPPPLIAPLPAPTDPAMADPIANPIAVSPVGDRVAHSLADSLNDSDKLFATAVLALPGAEGLKDLLKPENLIRRLVATIDNLPRHRLAVDSRPLNPTSGAFQVNTLGNHPAAAEEEHATLDAANARRYAPAVAWLGAIDERKVVALYRQNYPLFQQAYQDLGYPQGYFNDRLVGVIDHLLATPAIKTPVVLVRPKVFWEFADPELEARSSGQKLLLRLGAENAAVVMGKLRQLRALVATQPPSSTPSPTPSPTQNP